MDIYAPFVRHIMEPMIAWREGSSHFRTLAKLEASQYWSLDQIHELQLERLRTLLLHAQRNCPFYAQRFAESGFDPARLARLEDLKTLPPITKTDIQRHAGEMTAGNIAADHLVTNQTGGSTGAPLRFLHNRECLFSRKAATIRHDRWAGWDIGQKMGVLWGNRVDFSAPKSLKQRVLTYLVDRRLILDTSNITGDILAEFSRALNKYRPPVYLAYANAAYLFARYLKEKGGDFHRPNAIITSAELLADEQRRLIEDVFACKVFDRYGCRETSVVASECSHHDGLHVNAEHLLLEVVYATGGPQAGQPGRIVITDLLNFGMPLIRYQIEDMGVPLAGACPCGRGLPRLRMAGGRVTDFLITPEGKVISGAALTIYFVATVPGIAQAQLIQKAKESLVLKVVRGPAFGPESERLIRAKVLDFFGPKMHYAIEFVETIAPTASGKHRFSICELDPMEYLT
jgi:phenylacetate-CoA ligase